ncbi:Hypothetical protein D9617_10g071890 [Elsinoe fawcettii]|nr:Hypothetical protein D9617_10g071890 [Elsinoe fawcettii]
MPSKVKGELTFLGRSLLWEQEKPYRMRFALANGFPESNFIYETQEVAVKSLRDGLASLSLDTNGFEIHDFTSKLEYPDFEHYDKVRSSYIEEISDFVKSLRGASHVHALDHE